MPDVYPAARDRVLVLMRHAKAESWGDSDHDRRLAAQGVADAASAGRWLAELGVTPDRALVSSATRTDETWEAVSGAAGWALEPVLDDGLYAAEPDVALDLIRESPDDVGTLLMIGHNPTIAYLAQMLDDGDGEPAAIADMVTGYPTCALTVLTFAGEWTDLDLASASVVAFNVGRA